MGEKYEKLKILGRGTFGEAWLVVSKVSKRHYVMKEMNTGGWDDSDKDKSLNEFAEGGDLAALIKKQREQYRQFFPEKTILEDLKSQNIFITKQNIIKIGDFGISKLADLVQVLLRPVPERRPSVEQLLSCSTLEKEVEAYLKYVSYLKSTAELGNERERISSQSSKEDESRTRVGSQGSADGGYGSGIINQ